MKRVGIVDRNYNSARQIYGHEHTNYTFQKVIGYSQVAAKASRIFPFLFKSTRSYRVLNLPPRFPKVDFLHLWNSVAEGNTPWIVSTSIGFGRGNGTTEQARHVALLASRACKHIICTSQFAYDKQKVKASEWKQYESSILRKMRLLPPPQTLMIHSIEDKANYLDKERIIFTIVGNPIFFKGGLETLRVFDALLSTKYPVQLNVVTTFQLDGVFGTNHAQVEEAQKIIDKHKYINLYSNIANEEVITLLKSTHIGLLPSFSETYGNSVLEAQACGCPVITTDINAFPETNPPDCGWQIVVSDNYDISTPRGISTISAKIETQLLDIIRSIVESPSTIAVKGGRSIERIRRAHDPENHKNELANIYDSMAY